MIISDNEKTDENCLCCAEKALELFMEIERKYKIQISSYKLNKATHLAVIPSYFL